jgi:branched-chain amino acid transport system substrate-binding protein
MTWTASAKHALRMLGACLFVTLGAVPVRAAEPIKVGFSMALTGSVAPNGRQLLSALEIWRDDVNAKGGLLGRPVALVFYDDQSNPSNVPGIYTKLLGIDKVDLLLGPYATNMVAAAMPVIAQSGKLTISLLAIGVNRHFNYSKYFSMVPVGPEGVKAFSRGFFELAAAQKPKPDTVAVIAADAEFAKTAADGARENAQALGFKIIYDKTYPPATTDLAPVMRALQSANADVVFVAAYPPDTVSVVRAANEIGLAPKMFGGAMIGLLVTPIKVQLGPLMNGIVIMESFVPAPSFNFPGLESVLSRYRDTKSSSASASSALRVIRPACVPDWTRLGLAEDEARRLFSDLASAATASEGASIGHSASQYPFRCGTRAGECAASRSPRRRTGIGAA